MTSAGPGSFATERFRARRRAWWRRIWWIVLALALVVAAISVTLGALLRPDDLSFFLGFGIGMAAATIIVLADSPPNHIERWREGAKGEQQTAKALRPLIRDGWTLANDIDNGRGNLDHILIGPPGILVLESKNLRGLLTVRDGILTVRWREDPEDGYENFRLAHQMRSRVRDVERRLRQQGVDDIVQPVVVLWGSFPQRSILSREVAWVRGKELRRVLEARPTRLSRADIERATFATQRAFAGPDDAP